VEQQVASRWNALAERHDIPLRLEVWGAVSKGGLRFRELESGAGAGVKAIEMLMPSVAPDKWMSDVFIMLSLLMGSETVHPAMFEAQARRHWEERLRKTVDGKAFDDFAKDRERVLDLKDNQRSEQIRDIRRRGQNLSDHLATHGIDAFVPPGWPTKDGVTPVLNPHEARNEIVI